MIEILVTLFLFGSGIAFNELSAEPETFSIERGNCEHPTSRFEERFCERFDTYGDD